LPPGAFPSPFPNSIGKKDPFASSEGSGEGLGCKALGEGLGVGEGFFVAWTTAVAEGFANAVAFADTEGITDTLATGEDDKLGAALAEAATEGDALGELLTAAIADALA
jgi:hypothetical protein